MSATNNKLIVRRFWEEVVNRGQLGLIDKLFAPDCDFHDPLNKGKDLDTIKDLVKMMRTAFPDVEVNIEAQMAAEGDRVITQWTGTGTHTGRVDCVEPTGERVEMPGTSISRVDGDYIEETWFVLEPLERQEDDEVDEGPGNLFCKYFPRLC